MPDNAEQQALAQGLQNLPRENKFYFNGFALASSPTDVSIILVYNNQVVSLVTTTMTMAKTLHSALGVLIAEYEKKTGHIPSLDELNTALAQKN